MRVIDADEQDLGTVKAVQNFGASDLLEIKPKIGAAYFHPFTDDFVLSLDEHAGTITIVPMEMI